MRHPISILMLFLVFVISVVASNKEVVIREQKLGSIQGTIYDPAGSRIVNAKIRLERNKQTQGFTSSSNGEYSAKVLTGIYTVTVLSNGFYGIRRAAVKIDPGSTIIFDFVLEVGEFDRETSFHYEDISLSKKSDQLLLPLMRYACRNETQDTIEYEGLIRYWTEGNGIGDHVDKKKYIGPTLSYDRLTIHADTISIDKRTLALEADGNVMIEDGSSSTILMKRAKLDLNAKNPITTLSGEKTTELNQPVRATIGQTCGDRIPH